MSLVVAFSGGKDSTAMAYRLARRGTHFTLLFTPTGNELPEVARHVRRTARQLKRRLVIPPGPSLDSLIDSFGSLPNNRQRWCTRMIKIQPCIAWLKQHPGSVLAVGLRADEPEREGLYGDFATYRFPLREWNWGVNEVVAYLARLGVTVPARTDCALCYDQRLIDWRNLLRKQPEMYARGEKLERQTGHTFRSPSRDNWPAALKDLRVEFASGRKIRGENAAAERCQVCRI